MKIVVIGAGFGGLSAAAYLAKAGHDVTVLEKNAHPGGRANAVYANGFQFDLGPSWYLMPDVFEEFFADFGHKSEDFYELTQLVPSYKVFDQDGEFLAHPYRAALMDFENREVGAGPKVAKLLKQTKKEYEIVREDILPLSGLSQKEYLKKSVFNFLQNPAVMGSYHSRIAKTVKNETSQHVLEFMTVFLGGAPSMIPAAYGMLAHVDFGLGIWYPHGGFAAVAKAFEHIAKEQGANIIYNAPVSKIIAGNKKITAVKTNKKMYAAEKIVANADYHFVDTKLTPDEYRIFSEQNWDSKTLSPSAVLAAIGVSKKLDLEHHNLFFDTDWDGNFDDVFKNHKPNEKPLFYASVPSKTDLSVAPEDHENIFLLLPVSTKMEMGQKTAEKLVQNAIKRIEQKINDTFQENIIYKKVYKPEYFEKTFNAFSGNAFGLSHTLKQSGPFRPPIRSPKLPDLYFTGQYTNPGTGVPLVVLSGKNVAREIGI